MERANRGWPVKLPLPAATLGEVVSQQPYIGLTKRINTYTYHKQDAASATRNRRNYSKLPDSCIPKKYRSLCVAFGN